MDGTRRPPPPAGHQPSTAAAGPRPPAELRAATAPFCDRYHAGSVPAGTENDARSGACCQCCDASGTRMSRPARGQPGAVVFGRAEDHRYG